LLKVTTTDTQEEGTHTAVGQVAGLTLSDWVSNRGF